MGMEVRVTDFYIYGRNQKHVTTKCWRACSKPFNLIEWSCLFIQEKNHKEINGLRSIDRSVFGPSCSLIVRNAWVALTSFSMDSEFSIDLWNLWVSLEFFHLAGCLNLKYQLPLDFYQLSAHSLSNPWRRWINRFTRCRCIFRLNWLVLLIFSLYSTFMF